MSKLKIKGTKKIPKPRNIVLTTILISKTSSGASGKHVTLNSKQQIKRTFQKFQRKGYYDD